MLATTQFASYVSPVRPGVRVIYMHMLQQNSWPSLVALSLSLALTMGCSRTRYRQAADKESYCLIESREVDPRWEIPNRAVEPQADSRMYMGAEQDHGPKPLDDAAAKQFMDHPDGINNEHYYSKIPTRLGVENPIWLDYLPRQENGNLYLSQPLAIDLALINSRDYQTQFENVYLVALLLSGNRFEFATQWFGGAAADFTATGADAGDQRLLRTTTDRLGFTRNLAGGGQFATSILNSLFWDFGSSGIQGGSAALVTVFTQPLLRGAFRHVRLEGLTQAERNLLYSVRDFARFRRQFYFDTTASFLGLLTQVQGIRNLETNVENLRQNLEEYEVLVSLKMASQIQADTVFQQYQDGRLSLLSSEQNLMESFDQFKFQLGLPSWLPMEIDESLLERFELVDKRLEELQVDSQSLYVALAQTLPTEYAPRESLEQGFAQLLKLRDATEGLLPEVEQELASWTARLDATDVQSLGQDDHLDHQQQIALANGVEAVLTELRKDFAGRQASEAKLRRLLDAYPATAPPSRPKFDPSQSVSVAELLGDGTFDDITLESVLPTVEADPVKETVESLQEAVGDELREEIADLYIAQTQVRLFLIDIEPQTLNQDTTISYALQNRLDLMNSQATVVDAFRRVEVLADNLQSDLSVSGGVSLGSDPSKNNAFRLDSSANRYNVGVQFDGPLNRLDERNEYRASQIAYQRAGRNFMAERDRVANEVRSILRQLELSRLSFQISRQQVVAATRQVDQAQINLRTTREPESNLTIFLLDALEGMLSAKNNLISNWVGYRVQKMRLFVALEMLYLDDNGTWLNEDTGLQDIARFTQVDLEYFPLYGTTELPEILPRPSEALDELPRDVGAGHRDSSQDGESEQLPLPDTIRPVALKFELPELPTGPGAIVVPSVPYEFDFQR